MDLPKSHVLLIVGERWDGCWDSSHGVDFPWGTQNQSSRNWLTEFIPASLRKSPFYFTGIVSLFPLDIPLH